ncbi:hypothetical protein LguiA_008469 [Lonicera macranthoides]
MQSICIWHLVSVNPLKTKALFDNNMENDKKTLDLCKKLENELRHVMRCLHLMLIFTSRCPQSFIIFL